MGRRTGDSHVGSEVTQSWPQQHEQVDSKETKCSKVPPNGAFTGAIFLGGSVIHAKSLQTPFLGLEPYESMWRLHTFKTNGRRGKARTTF